MSSSLVRYIQGDPISIKPKNPIKPTDQTNKNLGPNLAGQSYLAIGRARFSRLQIAVLRVRMCFEPGSFREKAPSNCVCSYVCNYESTSVYTHTCGSALRTWNMRLLGLPKGKPARWVFLALHTEERRLPSKPESHLLPSRMTFLL